MKLLELFCGTKSVGKVAEKLDIDTVSLDILPKFNPDVCCNIMYFDYLKTAHPEGHFDFIWASLSCTELEHPMGGSPDSNAPMAHYTYLRRLR